MKKLLIALLILLGLAIAGAIGLRIWLDPDNQRERIAALLGSTLGRDVELGPMSLTLLPLAFSAEHIAIAERAGFGDEPFLAADALRLRLAWGPLLRDRTLQFESIDIEAPRLRLARNARGQWNFDDLGAGEAESAESDEGPGLGLVIDRLRLRNGRLTLVEADGTAKTWENLDLDVSDLAIDRAAQVRFGAAQDTARLRLQGEFGPLVAGQLLHSPLAADVELTGFALADGDDDTGLDGVLDFRGRIQADAGKAHSTGQASLGGFRLGADATPAITPLRLDYRFDYDLERHRGQFSDTRMGVGAASFALGGGVDLSRSEARLDLRVDGSGVPLEPLQDLLPALGIVMPARSRLAGGTLDTRLQLRGTPDTLVISGPASVTNTRLAGFSLGQRMAGLLSLGGVQMPADTVLRRASTQLRVDAAAVALDGIEAEVERLGQLTGQGRINADESLDFRLRLRLDESLAGAQSEGGSGLTRTLRGLLDRGSRDGIGVRIDGQAADPRIRVDPAALVGLGDAARTQSREQEESPSLRDRLRRLRER